MNSKLNVDYKSLIQQKNVIEYQDFERIVQEVYGFSVFQGECFLGVREILRFS